MIERIDREEDAEPRTRLKGVGFGRAAWAVFRETGERTATHQATILLALAYVLVVLPVGILARLFRWDPFERHPLRIRGTGWIAREPRSRLSERLY